MRTPLRLLRLSFRQALVVSGVVTLGALLGMAAVLALSLQTADRLLDRLSWSQSQLAEVARLEAGTERLRADSATGAPATETQRRMVAAFEAYRSSIEDEGRRLPARDTRQQSQEARTAAELFAAFDRLQERLRGGDTLGAAAAYQAFGDLAGQIVAKEQVEAQEAIHDMRNLRRRITLLGVAIPCLVALMAVGGAWGMLASMLRPLRALERATERAGDGAEANPVEVQGFTEFRRLADAFNRMEAQIAGQRQALEDANRGLEDQVRARTAQLEEVDRTRRLFFSKLGHELRTPATVILGEAEVALRDRAAEAPRLREALEHVAVNGAVLRRRLQDMLALALAEDGRIALASEPVDLAALVRTAAGVAEPFVRASDLSLSVRAPPAPGPRVQGDASWLQQALLAVLDNAAKFSPPGETVGVTLTSDDQAAEIAVSDAGPGVDPAEAPRLFDTYYQTSAGRARGGSGLGLSVARWVVEQHGGVITAEPGAMGLTIRMRLPLS